MLRPARIAILDPFAGISGDMLLGALLDVGVSPSWLQTLPQRLGFPRVSVEVRQVVRCGVRATKVDFRIPEGRSSLGHHGAHVGQLMEVVRQGQVAEPVKQRAVRAFELLDRKSTRLNSSHDYISYSLFFFNDPAPTELSPLSLRDALPILSVN